jgi:pimeloyl-ACP methyl ester carboxylesterase
MQLSVFERSSDKGRPWLIEHKDLRNHGDSPHSPIHDYSAMADDVEEFIEDHGIKLPTLIGHSMSVFRINDLFPFS